MKQLFPDILRCCSYGSEDAPITDIHEIPLLLVVIISKTRLFVHVLILCGFVNRFWHCVFIFQPHLYRPITYALMVMVQSQWNLQRYTIMHFAVEFFFLINWKSCTEIINYEL